MSLDYFGSKLLLKKWLYVEVVGGGKYYSIAKHKALNKYFPCKSKKKMLACFV